MKKEFLVVGSNNFWYMTVFSKQTANEEIERIRKQADDQRAAVGYPEELPDTFYIYEAIEKDSVDTTHNNEENA